MKINGLLRRWLGYSRREKVGSFILILVLATILVSRLISLADISEYDDIRSVNSDSLIFGTDSILSDNMALSEENEPLLSKFDPNTVTRGELLEMGLSERQASTLINYRQSGGYFNKAEDFRKIYGIPGSLQDMLIPYIYIEKGPVLPQNNRGGSEFREIEPIRGDSEITAVNHAKEIRPVEINHADSLQLMTIPGIGKVLGPRIVKYRSLLGGYSSVSQLAEVYGLDTHKLKSLYKYIVIDTSMIELINLNSASYSTLIRHPYITREITENILRYRQLEGKISSIHELLRNRILDEKEIEKLSPYLSVNDSIISPDRLAIDSLIY